MNFIELFNNTIEIIKTQKIKISILILSIIAFIIILGCIFLPKIFYDQWIWKYYWGPIVADASGGIAVHNGVEATEGYTIVSELTYGIILVIALYMIYVLLKRWKITVDWRFALSLMPYILYGPVTRVLEDTNFFEEPFIYWFISPLIYFQIAFFAIFFLYIGYYLERKLKNPKITVNKVLFLGGMILLVPAASLIISWILGFQWSGTSGVSFDVFLIVILLVFLIVGLVYLITHIFRKNKNLSAYKNPLNLSMLSGHLIDGITSYISIKDPFSMGLLYEEKHPASNFLLEIWGPLFPIVKFILIMLVIYLFDVIYKEDLKKYSTFANLLKIGILILGFSPGLRDLLRVTMGV